MGLLLPLVVEHQHVFSPIKLFFPYPIEPYDLLSHVRYHQYYQEASYISNISQKVIVHLILSNKQEFYQNLIKINSEKKKKREEKKKERIRIRFRFFTFLFSSSFLS